jgi:hypothetical protein
LRDKPEISLAVAVSDHNFSNLKEFALGYEGKMTPSDVPTGSNHQQTPHPSLSLSAPCPSVQVEVAAVPLPAMDDTANHPPQLALSLSHILDPTPSDNLYKPTKQSVACSPLNNLSTAEHVNSLLNKVSSTAEHINPPLPDENGMVIDLPPSDNSINSTEASTSNDMQLDDQESQKCDHDSSNVKKPGLLSWLNVSASKISKRKHAEILSLNSDESDSTSKNSLKGLKSISKKLKSVMGAVMAPELS